MARLAPRVEDAVDQLGRHLVELLVRAGLLQDFHRLDAGAHGQRVARQGARLVHGARGGHHLHNFLLAGVGADREASANHLAEGRQVGLDAPVLLRAAVRDAEARHDLIKHENRAVLGAELAQTGEELLVGHDEAGVADDALQNHAGHLALVGLEERLDRGEVVVSGHQGGRRGARGDAGRIGQAEGGNPRAGGDQERVGMTVVAPVKLDHLLALSVGAHQAKNAHARLSA
mmetsp:Transcript_10242/g.33786  ORF Transcript_10242/g.33786 Transcript_10242/m.33786 type:complete len:231 (-) Transcript_10242:480-1172(-)|eukprot:scaffold24215_cov129-Isochrysis_galbana.AAC.3